MFFSLLRYLHIVDIAKFDRYVSCFVPYLNIHTLFIQGDGVQNDFSYSYSPILFSASMPDAMLFHVQHVDKKADFRKVDRNVESIVFF